MTTVASCRNIVVVLPFVGGNHRLEVMRGPLNVLPDIAASTGALVVTPGKEEINQF